MKREKISMRRSTANLDTNYNWPGFFIHSTLISLRPFCVLSINPNSFPPNPHSKIDLQQRLICTGQCNGGLQMSKGICFNFSYFVFSDRFFFFFLRFWIGSNSEIWNLSRSISAAQIVVFPIFISMSEFRSSIPIFHSKKWKARNNFFHSWVYIVNHHLNSVNCWLAYYQCVCSWKWTLSLVKLVSLCID